MLEFLGLFAVVSALALWWVRAPRRTVLSGGHTLVHGDPLLGGRDPAPARPEPRPATRTEPRPPTRTDPRPAPRPEPRRTSEPAPARRPAPRRSAEAALTGFRPDIEGLRAIAVLLVLAYHAKVGPFQGGLVGVDVFFVLSGFLITSLLLRELSGTGTISLPGFWSRRVRRLLAASCLVIVTTLLLGRVMLAPLARRDLAHDALAACVFLVNIVFGRRNNDYLAGQLAQTNPSPLLHYWSLALEEQFYVVWPVLLLVVSRSRQALRAVGATIAVAGVASFAACLWFTNHSPVWAFYLLPTRAWELLAGAALAYAGTRVLRLPENLRAVLGWAGLGGVLLASLAISDHTKFPGYAATLPVLATVAVVAAGGAAARYGPGMLLRARPLQWVGKRSYAIYLWHWPAYVLAQAKWGPLNAAQRVGVMGVSVVVAAVSFAVLEDPVRHSQWLAARAERGLAMGAGLIAIGAAVAAFSLHVPDKLSGGGSAAAPDLSGSGGASTTTAPGDTAPADTSPRTTVAGDPASTAVPPIQTLGSLTARNTALLEQAVGTKVVPDNLDPDLKAAANDLPGIYDDGCLLNTGTTTAPACVYGDPNSSTTVVLAGDSHAAQWFPAVEEAAKRRGWRLVVLTKKGCSLAEFKTYNEGGSERADCVPWRKKVIQRVTDEHPALVIFTSYRYRLASGTPKSGDADLWRTALSTTLKALQPATKHLLVLSDTPNPTGVIPYCLSQNLKNVPKCVRDRTDADRAPLLGAERDAATSVGATFVVTSDWLCGATQCPVILGNLLLYRDDNHITATASRYFTPFIEAAAAPLLAG